MTHDPIPLLRVSGLTILSGAGEPLVSGLDFDLRAGETLGIVGESGSGKSLTCRAILGLLPPGLRIAEGAIRLEGRDLLALDARGWRAVRRDRFGAVFQEPGSYLNPSMRIGSQLAECLAHHGLRRDARIRAAELLDAVGIARPDAVLRQFPHELSGGMQQRVMIARALAGDPPILIADEVTTALDVLVQRQVIDLLRERQRARGLALLMISHDLALVSEICDRIVVMRAGRVVEQGPTRSVIGHPRSDYTRQMIADHRRFGLEQP